MAIQKKTPKRPVGFVGWLGFFIGRLVRFFSRKRLSTNPHPKKKS